MVRYLTERPASLAGGLLLALLFTSCGSSGPSMEEPGTYRVSQAYGDGTADASAHIRELLEEIDTREAILLVSGGTYLVDGVTIPGNVRLVFRDGGRFKIPDGGVVRLNGSLDAGLREVFSGSGSVAGAADLSLVYPQWFGALGDGASDDGPALSRAAEFAAGTTGNTLFIPSGEYLFRNDIVIRSNVESRGLLIKEIEIDEERTQFSQVIYVPTHHPVENPHIYFEPDHDEVELDPSHFYGMGEGEYTLQAWQELPLADGSGRLDLAEGGTLRFYSSDYFSSRNNQKGDQFYDRRDISQLVSARGDLFPELAFSYPAPPDAEMWRPGQAYHKGDYVTMGGEVFKATWASGEGSVYEHPFQGTVRIGSVQPDPAAETTLHRFTYPDGAEDTINIWRRVRVQVWYRPKDRPLTVNGLRMEIRLEGHEGETKRINAGAINVNRSNMTFNNLEITVRDREATLARLLSSNNAVNLEFNNGYFSGATSHGLGYNIRNNYVANVRYNDTISTNSRKGMDGHLSKNVTVNGGFYNVIDDHYSRNFVIRDVTLTGRSTYIPGYVTPEADLQQWGFQSIRPIGFTGGNLHVERVTILDGSGGILSVRGDIGDLYGSIVLRDIVVRGAEQDVRLIHHAVDPEFDFVSEVRTPERVVIDNVSVNGGGRLQLTVGRGLGGRGYGPVTIHNSGPIGEVYTGSSSMTLSGCQIRDASFEAEPGAVIHFLNCVFEGESEGPEPGRIGTVSNNRLNAGATASFPVR